MTRQPAGAARAGDSDGRRDRPWEAFGLTLGPPWPGRGPQAVVCRDVAGIAIGAGDRVHLFTRHEGQVLVYEPDGRFVHAFGRGMFTMPHAVTVDADGCIYCVDNGDHTVRKFSPSGELLMTLGTAHQGSDTGWTTLEPHEIEISAVEAVRYPGPPFNGCTDVAIGPHGDIYVADGYRNCRIHRFDAAGELLDSWGAPGSAPGEFHLPHCIVRVGERLLVADRENDRIQVFDLQGTYLESWTDLQRPTAIAVDPTSGRIFVTELPRPVGNRGFVRDTRGRHEPGRLAVLAPDGTVLGGWGRVPGGDMEGYFIAPHTVAVDRAGSVYVGEVTYTFGIKPGYVGEEYGQHVLQRFCTGPYGS